MPNRYFDTLPDEFRSSRMGQRIASGREYRNFRNFEIREAAAGGQAKNVEGYATTFGDEYVLCEWDGYRVLESFDTGAFSSCDMSDVIMQLNHEGTVYARMSNNTLSVAPDAHGLLCRADLSGTTNGGLLYEEIAGGYLTKMSIGFRVAKNEIIREEDHTTGILTVHRKITQVAKLYDVSAVSLPANDATEISARSAADGLIQQQLQEMEESRARAASLELRLRLLKMKGAK